MSWDEDKFWESCSLRVTHRQKSTEPISLETHMAEGQLATVSLLEKGSDSSAEEERHHVLVLKKPHELFKLTQSR